MPYCLGDRRKGNPALFDCEAAFAAKTQQRSVFAAKAIGLRPIVAAKAHWPFNRKAFEIECLPIARPKHLGSYGMLTSHNSQDEWAKA